MLSNLDSVPDNPYILSPKYRIQQIHRPELMKCTEIISRQQHKKPVWSDIQLVTKALMKLDIFNSRLVRQNINPKIIVERIIPFLDYEVFYATTPIIHYGQESSKLYVVCQGSAKEFIAKSSYEIQKDLREQQHKKSQVLPIPIINTETEEPDSSPKSTRKSPGRRTMKDSLWKDRKNKGSHSQTLENQKAFVESVLRGSSKFATALTNLKTVIALNSAMGSAHPTVSEKTFRRGALKGIHAEDYGPEREPGDYNFDGFRENRELYYHETVLKIKPARNIVEGQYFGFKFTPENIEPKPSAIVAWQDCYCLTIEVETLLRFIEEEKAVSAYKAELFSEIFPDNTKQSIINFAYFWREKNFVHNDPIFEQGDLSDSIFTLVSGEITFSKTVALPPKEPGQREEPNSASKSNKPSNYPKTTVIKVAKVCDGSFFGEEDFFLDQPRTLTATVTSTRAKILQLERKFYVQMLGNHTDMFEKIMSLSETKHIFKVERLENLNSISSGVKENKASEYSHLKDDIQIALMRPADPLPKLDGSSPKLKVYRNSKKHLSLHTNYKNIMNQIIEEHPVLMDFVTETKPIKNSHSKERVTTEGSESARLPRKIATEPNEPKSWLPSFQRGQKKSTIPPKSGGFAPRESYYPERESHDPLSALFNHSYTKTQGDTSLSQQSPLISKFNPNQTSNFAVKTAHSMSERSPLLSTRYKNINQEIRKCVKKLSEYATKSPRASSKGKLEPIFINTGKSEYSKTAAGSGNFTDRSNRASVKKTPLYSTGNEYIATTASSIPSQVLHEEKKSFTPFQDKPFNIETLDQGSNDGGDVREFTDDFFNFVKRKNRPVLKKV